MKYLSADIIYDGLGGKYTDHVLVMDGQRVEAIIAEDSIDDQEIEYHEGVLMPGLINTHCHLELSHMRGKVPTGTGLLPFIEHVVKHRDVDRQDIHQAIVDGDQEMYNNGIVAVGDISNTTDTATVKADSLIRYYTFVEMFDFMQADKTQETVDQYRTVYQGQAGTGQHRKSLVPHAPYTVSKGLFDYIRSNNEKDATVSIHNQETTHEDELFLTGGGGFADWYQQWGIALDKSATTGQRSIYYAMQHLDPQQRNLFVHNTMTTAADIAAAGNWSEQVYWATCPRANLYIENRLPYYRAFTEARAKMTIGTDSLTSNWSLDVWAEMQTILHYASYLTLDEVVVWATHNGASALGFDSELGSLTPGKSPGINLVACDVVNEVPQIQGTHIQRLV